MLSFEAKSQELISKVSQYPVLLDFWKNARSLDNLSLPESYPSVENILAFQNGYAYDSVSDKSLIGDKEGDFKATWLVIAANYFADPFLIDFVEASENFPVYFAFHGVGKWKPIKVADSIVAFQEILKTIFEDQSSKSKLLAYLQTLPNGDNEFWEEVYQNEMDDTGTTEDAIVVDPADWREVEIYITHIGPNKMKVVSLLKELHQLTGAEALEWSKRERIFYAKGPFKFMRSSMQQLENLGVSFELVEL